MLIRLLRARARCWRLRNLISNKLKFKLCVCMFFFVSFSSVCFAGRQSATKQSVELPLFDQALCTQRYRTVGIDVGELQLCAGGIYAQDTCDGDSGNSLMKIVSNAWVVEGIVSYGRGCGVQDWPAVYTRVSAFDQWIRSHLKPWKSNLRSFLFCNLSKMKQNHPAVKLTLQLHFTYLTDSASPCNSNINRSGWWNNMHAFMIQYRDSYRFPCRLLATRLLPSACWYYFRIHRIRHSFHRFHHRIV